MKQSEWNKNSNDIAHSILHEQRNETKRAKNEWGKEETETENMYTKNILHSRQS